MSRRNFDFQKLQIVTYSREKKKKNRLTKENHYGSEVGEIWTRRVKQL